MMGVAQGTMRCVGVGGVNGRFGVRGCSRRRGLFDGLLYGHRLAQYGDWKDGA